MENYNIENIVNNMIPPIQPLVESLQAKASVKLSNTNPFEIKQDGSEFSGVKTSDQFSKPSIEYRVDAREAYSEVGGEMFRNFPSYMPGRDNYEFAAQNQTTWDKWANGLTKASANLLTTVVGNTAGIVYGGINGITEGSWNAVFDNNFSNALADWNDKLNAQLPNYVSKQEQEEGFFGSLDNANFWANDVMGGLSFTLGTVVSEAIWAYATGGAGNIAKAGLKGAQATRWGLGAERTAKGIVGYRKFLDDGLKKLYTGSLDPVMKNASLYANTAKGLNTARFLATTSGNEAGIEALHYKREMKEKFYDNFEELNGRQPTQEEINEFENNLENSANAVFATNMAILMPSNLAMFGSMFNISKPFKGLTKSVDKTLFGIGVEKVDDVYKGIQATTRQKATRIGYGIIKPITTEGLWEEGLQGATTKTAENWITASYNPKYNNETMALADATYKGLAEQYGTKEGWKEIGIGAIIGGGMSVVLGKGKPQELREFEQQEKYQADYIAPALNKFGDNTAVATELLTKKMMLNSRIKSASENQLQAIKKGDDVGAMLAQQDFLVAELQFRKSIGENTKDLVSKYETALNALPKEAWEEAGIENVDEYKQNVISGYKTLVNNFEKASSFADNVLGETRILGQDVATQQLKDALTYSIVSGQTANKAMDTSLVEMAKIIGDDTIKARSIQDTLEKLGKNKQAQVRKLNSQVNQADTEVKKLSDELQKLQVSKDETKGERLAKVQAKLVEANDRLLKLREEREDLAKEVSQESKRRRSIVSSNIDEVSLTTDFITGEDLFNIDEKLKKIEDTIKSYEGVNHEVYYELLDLQKQYKSAKQKFFDYQASVDAIVSGNFAPKFEKMGGLLGKVFNSKEPLNNFSAEFLQDVYNKYVNSVGNLTVEDLIVNQFISDEEYKNFKESGEVSQEVKQKIAEKVKQKAELSEREKEIYKSFVDEINSLTKPNPNKPDLSIESLKEKQILELENEKRKLEEQLASTPETITTSDIEAKKADIEKELFSKTDDKGRTFTYYSTTKEKDGIITIKFLFNRSDKDSSQRANAVMGISVKKALGDKYTIDETYIPEGAKVVGVSEIRITKEGVGATVTFEVDEEKYTGEVKLNSNTTYDAELESLNNQTTSEQQTQAEATQTVEQQKADIERRREEELLSPSKLQKPTTDTFILDYRNKGKKIVEEAVKAKASEYILKVINLALKGRSAKTIAKETGLSAEDVTLIRFYLGIPSSGGIGFVGATTEFTDDEQKSYDDWKNEINKINNNYDAELKSLEEKGDGQVNKETLNLVYEELRKEISKINKKIDSLKTEDKDLSEAQKLRKEIEKAFEKDYPLLTTDVDELINDKPTKEEIERYLELYSKQEKFDLFEQKEFSELQPRMQKWFMAQSLPVGGLSVADLAELISQLETQIDKEETLTEVNDSDLLPFAEEEARAINRVDILQNIAGSAVAKIKDNKIFFIHVNTKGILDKLVQNGVTVTEVQTVRKDGKLNKAEQLTPKLLNKNTSISGTVFKIGEVSVVIGDRGNVVMSLEDYNKVKDVLNLHYYDSRTGKWSYADLYEQLPDGTKVKKQSEYVTNTNSDNIYEVEQGEDLKPFVDMSTDWNNNLITKALQEIEKDGIISDETKTEIKNGLEITTKSGRNNNSTMKASSQESVDDNFLLIRKRFADKFIETLETEQALATLPKKIELEIEFPVSEIFLGTPEFVLDGSNKPIDFEITERGTENVITQGYVQGSKIVLADKKINLDKVSRLFVSNIAKANPSAKIPVILLQKGKHQFVFPITLNKTNESQVEKLDAILAKDLTPVEEVKAINNLLISLGSNTRISGLSDIAIEDIREELENYTTFVSADTLANVEYDKANLSVDATAKIDLEDRLISSPKITVDYSKAVIGTKDQNETDAINLRADIIKDIVEVRKIVNTAPDMPDNKIVKAFDENDILNQGSDIMNRRDVKYIREMFFNENGRLQLQGKAVDIIGREKLIKIREKLELLEFYENQIKTIKDKETSKKLNCN